MLGIFPGGRCGRLHQTAVLADMVVQRPLSLLNQYQFPIHIVCEREELLFRTALNSFAYILPDRIKSCIRPITFSLQTGPRKALHSRKLLRLPSIEHVRCRDGPCAWVCRRDSAG